MSQVLLQPDDGPCTAFCDTPCADPARILVSFAGLAGQAARDRARAASSLLPARWSLLDAEASPPAQGGPEVGLAGDAGPTWPLSGLPLWAAMAAPDGHSSSLTG